MSGTIRVDIIACDGVGICAHLAPDVVRVDSWGFPILPAEPLTGARERQARAAVTACPRKALFLARRPDPPVRFDPSPRH